MLPQSYPAMPVHAQSWATLSLSSAISKVIASRNVDSVQENRCVGRRKGGGREGLVEWMNGLTRITSPKFIRHHTLHNPFYIFRLWVTSTCVDCRFVDFIICCVACLQVSSGSLVAGEWSGRTSNGDNQTCAGGRSENTGKGWNKGEEKNRNSPVGHSRLDAYLLLIVSVMPLSHHQWYYIYHEHLYLPLSHHLPVSEAEERVDGT